MVALEVMQQFNGRGSQGKGFLRLSVKFVYVLGHASYDLKLIEAQVNFRRVVYIVWHALFFWTGIFCAHGIRVVAVLVLILVLLELAQLALQAAYAPVHFSTENNKVIVKL